MVKFRKAVLIQCHMVTSSLIYTVNTLSECDCIDVYIHVDLKSNIDDFLFLSKSNVNLLDKRISVEWGRISQVDATLLLLNVINEKKYDYISLISGDDIPTKPIDEIISFLIKNKGKEFLGVRPKKEEAEYEKRVKYKFPRFFFIRNKKNVNVLFEKIFWVIFSFGFFENKDFSKLPTLYKGCNWFTLTGDCVAYLKGYIKNNNDFYLAFKNSYCADEIFFQTIIMNSRFHENINTAFQFDDSLSALRLIEWGVAPDNPKIFSLDDLEYIRKSESIFCRKIAKDISVEELESHFYEN